MDTQETKIYLAALIAAGVLGIILVYFLITIIRQQRKTRKLNQEKIQAEIKTLEKDRARIASDLHDELGPLLSAIKFKINSLDTELPDDMVLIQNSNIIIDKTIRRLREISNNLMPALLQSKGLIKAVEEFIAGLSGSTTMRIYFDYNLIPDLPAEKTIHIYRIIQEVTHNAIKHAAAKNLFIELQYSNDKLYIKTVDDGNGFAGNVKLFDGKGLGLYNLQSRTDLLNGEWFINSLPGQGVHYLFEFPITKD